MSYTPCLEPHAALGSGLVEDRYRVAMNIDRAINILTAARKQADEMISMYRDLVIPKATSELVSAQNQLNEYETKIVEIDELLTLVKLKV